MPCYEPPEFHPPLYSSNPEAEAAIKRLEARVSELTDMLCWLCRHADPNVVNGQHLGLMTWWRKHQAFDKADGRP